VESSEAVFIFQAIGGGLAVKFGVRVDEKVEGVALLRGLQSNIATEAEHHTILVRGAEEVIALLRIFPSL